MADAVRVALFKMERAFRRIECMVPSPKQQPWKGGFVFRYKEKSIEQALVQKCARLVSGLNAMYVLLESGFVQEQAVIQRTLDEINDDIMFLSTGASREEITDLHKEYLDAFYEEEFDKPENISQSTQKRKSVPRKKIIAYISKFEGNGNPHSAQKTLTLIHKAYSGFVHAASPQIMDMWGGNPPRFFVNGMAGTSRVEEHRRDAWNYVYRGLISFAVVAKAFGDKAMLDRIMGDILEFETNSRPKSAQAGDESPTSNAPELTPAPDN